jgi:2-C-methyl-D-erythritol 2,4-cyclodiphosphate synthase
MANSRTGFGFDSHRFGPGDHIVLGGVRIPFGKGVEAHSDGDIVLHALTDALLGSIAAGDIGDIFPNNDSQWEGAESSMFVRWAAELIAKKGYSISNCDITIVAEAPRLGETKTSIIESIAEILNIEPACISVKAKTAEGMGFIGKGEGIAAFASILIEKSE